MECVLSELATAEMETQVEIYHRVREEERVSMIIIIVIVVMMIVMPYLYMLPSASLYRPIPDILSL